MWLKDALTVQIPTNNGGRGHTICAYINGGEERIIHSFRGEGPYLFIINRGRGHIIHSLLIEGGATLPFIIIGGEGHIMWCMNTHNTVMKYILHCANFSML